jgi:hypothetical protein
VYGLSVIDGGRQRLLRGFSTCLKIAIRTKISASQKLLHGVLPSARNNRPNWGISCFSKLKLIIPLLENKMQKPAPGDCLSFHFHLLTYAGSKRTRVHHATPACTKSRLARRGSLRHPSTALRFFSWIQTEREPQTEIGSWS